MTYHGRVVVVGIYNDAIFTGNILQSKSAGKRIILPWKNCANVVPSEEGISDVAEQLRRGDISITHNSYPCCYGFHDSEGNTYIVGCNGSVTMDSYGFWVGAAI